MSVSRERTLRETSSDTACWYARGEGDKAVPDSPSLFALHSAVVEASS